MSSNVQAPIADELASGAANDERAPREEAAPSATPRFLALSTLLALLVGGLWFARGIHLAIADAWVVPISLSIDNDQVLQSNVKLNEQQMQREKMRVDIERIDADVQGIEQAIVRLRQIEHNAQESLRWTAYTTKAQSAAAAKRIRALEEQQRILNAMFARQDGIAQNAKHNSDAGLISRHELEREKQVLDQILLNRVQTTRETADSQAQQAQLFAMSAALGAAPRDKGLPSELMTTQERDARLALDLIRLESEKRALVAQRAISVESLGRIDDVLKQLKARPLYRAVEANTDIAFVPYTQLDDVEVGADLVSCRWVLFRCRHVGRVAEVLPGEVVAHDPWSQQARGQYIILDLDEHGAAKEKILRARKGR
ncbi:MAG: hypothetical protein KF764_01590 [Labilithrix sp.]|nr:hypothetical protein [Labilithrix sp.]